MDELLIVSVHQVFVDFDFFSRGDLHLVSEVAKARLFSVSHCFVFLLWALEISSCAHGGHIVCTIGSCSA